METVETVNIFEKCEKQRIEIATLTAQLEQRNQEITTLREKLDKVKGSRYTVSGSSAFAGERCSQPPAPRFGKSI
jgi:predicted RNase H-like nuclease (RuvC/YqgF family)